MIASRTARIAELALLVGTVFWGCSFMWAKDGAVAVNVAAHLPETSPLGPLILLGTRFTIGGLLWLAIFPQSRRGWSLRAVGAALALGALLSVAMSCQVLGLLITSEAVSAFLTSLTVLFVPLLTTLILRKPPPALEWLGVALATAGIYLMTSPSSTQSSAPSPHHFFSPGILLGLAASMGFAVYILAVNHLIPRHGAQKMTAGQFLACGVVTLLGLGVFSVFRHSEFGIRHFLPLFTAADPRRAMILLILFPTLCAYGLLNRFQPHLDPTRAAILYLAEPIFAAGYAWAVAGRGMSHGELAGAGLILLANAVVEFLKPVRIP